MNQIARVRWYSPDQSLIHFYAWPIEMVLGFHASMVSGILAIQQQWFGNNIRRLGGTFQGGTFQTLDKQTEGLQQGTAASAQRIAASAQTKKGSVSRSWEQEIDRSRTRHMRCAVQLGGRKSHSRMRED